APGKMIPAAAGRRINIYRSARPAAKIAGIRGVCAKPRKAWPRSGRNRRLQHRVPAGRHPEEARIFTAELGRALVADAIGDPGYAAGLGGDHPARLDQPKLLLVLKRGHRGERLEMLVEGRGAHAGRPGQIGYPDGPREVLAQQGERPTDALGVALGLSEPGDRGAMGTGEQPVINLPKRLPAEDREGRRRIEKPQQTFEGTGQSFVYVGDEKSEFGFLVRQAFRSELGEDLGDQAGIELQR